MTVLVYKIMRRSEWTSAQKDGVFAGSPDDARDGFIHLSSASQVRGVCGRHFGRETDLLLLAFDAAGLAPALKWETSHKGEAYPHLYAALPLALVQSIAEIRRGSDGRFVLPPEIP